MRISLIVLIAMLSIMTLTACGVKGDPVPPGYEPSPKPSPSIKVHS